MKITVKIMSLIISLSMIIGILFVSVISGSAIVEIKEGDFSFVKNSDDTCSVYRYYGTDKDIVLPKEALGRTVSSIYSHCFENSDITSVTIPDCYTSIGESAFYGCKNITSVYIPSSITSIGSMSFNSCTSLSSFDISDAVSLTTLPYAVFQGDTALTDFEIPPSITTIADRAFSRTGLKTIVVPDTVAVVGEYAFNGCQALTDVTLPKGIKEISGYTFNGCSSLTDVNIPSTVTLISECAFLDCTSLQSVELPENLTEIGNKAFYNCSALTSIDLPNTLTRIGRSTFENASVLKEIFVPDSVTDIGGNAFYPMSVQNKLTVTCYKGAYAENYCNENYVTVNAIEKLLGDANIDGDVNISDVTAIQRYRIGEDTISTYRAKGLADVNGDGKVTIRDATKIQMYIAKIITEF